MLSLRAAAVHNAHVQDTNPLEPVVRVVFLYSRNFFDLFDDFNCTHLEKTNYD